MRVENCPNCGSRETGIIKTRSLNSAENMKEIIKYSKKGIGVYYIEPGEISYEDRYCKECHWRWRHKDYKDEELTYEERGKNDISNRQKNKLLLFRKKR